MPPDTDESGGIMNQHVLTHALHREQRLFVIVAMISGLVSGAGPNPVTHGPTIAVNTTADELTDGTTTARIQAALGKLPLYFIENLGQI